MIYLAALVLGSIAHALHSLCRLLVLPCQSCLFAGSSPLASRLCLWSVFGLWSDFSVSVVGWVGSSVVVPFSVCLGWGVGPGPEPWTGLHCSELHWR